MDWKSRNLFIVKKLDFLFVLFLLTTITSVFSSTAVTEKPALTTPLSGVTDSSSSSSNSNNNNTAAVTNSTVKTTQQTVTTTTPPETTPDTSYIEKCPDGARCKDLGVTCIECKLNHYCVYGEKSTGNCTVKPNITCTGEKTFQREYQCSYGYQLASSLYKCDTRSEATSCTVKQAPLETYTATCTVKDEVLCLGNRTFQKKFPCNWTSGYKWSTAMVLSVTLGGFGVDRFYLGLWREGIGKLFSFGGLGVWTILDVILIAVGYVGPHDGSLYIYPWD